jgi:CheY-like chemotaxis protein
MRESCVPRKKKINLSGEHNTTPRILLAAASESRRSVVRALLAEYEIVVEEANESTKAINMARTQSAEITLVIVELAIPLKGALEVVREIKTLPNQKRARFCILLEETIDKQQLVPFVKLGVRLFARAQTMAEDLRVRLKELDIAPR